MQSCEHVQVNFKGFLPNNHRAGCNTTISQKFSTTEYQALCIKGIIHSSKNQCDQLEVPHKHQEPSIVPTCYGSWPLMHSCLARLLGENKSEKLVFITPGGFVPKRHSFSVPLFQDSICMCPCKVSKVVTSHQMRYQTPEAPQLPC